MKKISILMIAALAALVACQKEAQPQSDARSLALAVLHAGFEAPAMTRAGFDYDEADKSYSHFWETGDCIAFFPKEDRPDRYKCTDPEAGTFELDWKSKLSHKRADYTHNYAIYPSDYPIGIMFNNYTEYDEELVELMEMEYGMGYPISTTNPPVLQIEVPGYETYAEEDGTYGYGNIMVARSTDDQLKFKSVMGWLKLQLTGAAPLKTIRVTADQTAGSIALQGAGRIQFASDGTPSLEMETECDAAKPWKEYRFGSNVVVLDPVNPTSVYLALPPTVFAHGFTVKVTYADNSTTEFSTTRSITIQRNRVTPMAVKEGKDMKAILVDGNTFCSQVKTLANGTDYTYTTGDNKIKQVVVRKGSSVTSSCIVSASGSDYPVYAVFDAGSGVVTLHTPAYHLALAANSNNLFRGFRAMTALDWDQLDTRDVTTAMDMFYNCAALTSAPDVHLPKAVSVAYLFASCSGLTSFGDVSFPAALDANNLFSSCTLLASVGDVNLPNATNVSNLFMGCSVLSSIGSLNLPKVTNISHLFDGCKALATFGDVSFGTVTSASYLFNGCSALTTVGTIQLPNVTDASHFFSGCSSLASVGAVNLPLTTKLGYLFSGCSSLTSVNLVTGSAVTDMGYMFNGCSSLTSLGSYVPTSSVVAHLEHLFYGCSSLPTVDVSGLSGTLTGIAGMFGNCSLFTEIRFNTGLNTADVTDMSDLFRGCSGLTALDVSVLNTAKATNMSRMFWGCSGLSSLDLSGFSTDKVVETESMFRDCSSLTTIGSTAKFTCTALERCAFMFCGCSQLGNVDISQMKGTLKGASSGSSANLDKMFYHCSSMTTIRFNAALYTDGVYSYESIFEGCSSLTQLYVKGFYLGKWSNDNTGLRFSRTMTGVRTGCTVHYSGVPSMGTHANSYDMPSMFAYYSSPSSSSFIWTTAN